MNNQLAAGSRQKAADSGPVQKPAICNRQSGISLTEVLIAMGVLTVGLLSVAAIFPVGGYYMRRGEISDRGSAIAQAAFNEMATRGMLNPENWLTVEMDPAPDNSADRFNFRPAPEEMREEIAEARRTRPDLAARQQLLAQRIGTAFVIDPWAVSNIAGGQDASVGMNVMATTFPITWIPDYRARGDASLVDSHWWTWDRAWPMRRLTLGVHDPSGNRDVVPMSPTFAGSLVNAGDDLVMDDNQNQDSGRTQPWNLAAGGVPLSRQSRGEYSWIATINPTTPEARDALAIDPSAHSYLVSVVVFHKRAMGNLDQLKQSERTVKATVVSTDLTGGELLLDRIPAGTFEPAESPFEALKTGQYVMLSGPHAGSTPQRPIFFLNWYRVLSVDDESVGNPNTQRLVALRGPQWPWAPDANLSASNVLANDLRVGIFPGAVAVHSKTMRLEGNSMWNVQ